MYKVYVISCRNIKIYILCMLSMHLVVLKKANIQKLGGQMFLQNMTKVIWKNLRNVKKSRELVMAITVLSDHF